MIKILNITTMVGLRGGDAQMYTVYKLLKDEPDFKQFILCPENADLAKTCQIDKANLFTYKKNKFRVLNTIKAIVKVCKKEKIEILHIHDSSALTYSLIASIVLPKSLKLVLGRKRNNPIKDKFLNHYKYSNSRIIKIISVSKAVEKIFDKIIKDRDRLEVIYDAIDVSSFSTSINRNLLHQEFNWGEKVKIVGNIAGLTNQKDIFTFIRVAENIIKIKPPDLNIKFIIIGDGPLKNALVDFIIEKKLENDLFLLGFRSNVQELLPEFDVFLMTSITEGLPLSIYEAFASKVPVVSTDAGGIKEVLIDGFSGFITPIKDVTLLSNKVLSVLKDNSLKNLIIENAYNTVLNNHDLPIMKLNYIKFYKKISENA